jgi:hypothetical protein
VRVTPVETENHPVSRGSLGLGRNTGSSGALEGLG